MVCSVRTVRHSLIFSSCVTSNLQSRLAVRAQETVVDLRDPFELHLDFRHPWRRPLVSSTALDCDVPPRSTTLYPSTVCSYFSLVQIQRTAHMQRQKDKSCTKWPNPSSGQLRLGKLCVQFKVFGTAPTNFKDSTINQSWWPAPMVLSKSRWLMKRAMVRLIRFDTNVVSLIGAGLDLGGYEGHFALFAQIKFNAFQKSTFRYNSLEVPVEIFLRRIGWNWWASVQRDWFYHLTSLNNPDQDTCFQSLRWSGISLGEVSRPLLRSKQCAKYHWRMNLDPPLAAPKWRKPKASG